MTPTRSATVAPCVTGVRLAVGTELLGEFQNSGYVDAPFLARLDSGRMVEISQLLHLVASELGEERDLRDVAAAVSTRLGRTISAESVSYLIERKLRPLGLIHSTVDPIGTPPVVGLALQIGVIPSRIVGAIAGFLRPLFLPPVVVVAVTAVLVADGLLLRSHGGELGIDQFLVQPTNLLAVICLILLAGVFHELGHATASRYGGAEPGVIGAGLYLTWPVFYNDLNDSYRLSRAGRLRADLGGVYFNALFILGLAAGYGLTGFKPLVVGIVFQHLSILQQFLPFLRLDGYYIVSDAAGVPDLSRHIRPVLARLVPGPPKLSALDRLKPRARALVTVWVLLTVPLLGASLVALVATMPKFAAATWSSLDFQASVLSSTTSPLEVMLGMLHLLILGVPWLGLSIAMTRTLRRSGRHEPFRSNLASARYPRLAVGVGENGG